MKHGEKKFKYLSKERVQEVYQVFETLRPTDFPNYNYSSFNENSHEMGKPFKKFSILQEEGIEFELTSNS